MRRPPLALFLRDTQQLTTLGQWLRYAVTRYETEQLALGQIATTAHDEALYLILHTLGLPIDSDESVLATRLEADAHATLCAVFQKRIFDKIPAAYLTREAWLNELRFYVDERVLIPRSYFLEIIPKQLDDWLPVARHAVSRAADVCTGSGCLAILLARHFPSAQVDAIDLSSAALEVAAINVRDYGLEDRIRLHQSDVFEAVPLVEKYDLILSNPPYEPSARCATLPAEFTREPRLALDGGRDGLDIIRKLIAQARERLTPDGVLLIEVGGLQRAMRREFGHSSLHWLPTADGSNCICAIKAAQLS